MPEEQDSSGRICASASARTSCLGCLRPAPCHEEEAEKDGETRRLPERTGLPRAPVRALLSGDSSLLSCSFCYSVPTQAKKSTASLELRLLLPPRRTLLEPPPRLIVTFNSPPPPSLFLADCGERKIFWDPLSQHLRSLFISFQGKLPSPRNAPATADPTRGSLDPGSGQAKDTRGRNYRGEFAGRRAAHGLSASGRLEDRLRSFVHLTPLKCPRF